MNEAYEVRRNANGGLHPQTWNESHTASRQPLNDWKTYGNSIPAIQEYASKDQRPEINVVILDVAKGAEHGNFTRVDVSKEADLFRLVTAPPPSGTKFRYIGCNQLSSNALKIIGSSQGIHLDFWRWVLSDEAADGYWNHSHDSGRVLCFDLATFENYVAEGYAPNALLFGGRFRQLSSIHTFADEKPQTDPTQKAVQTNRRVTGYLTPGAFQVPTFIYFCEAVPSIVLEGQSLRMRNVPAARGGVATTPATSTNGIVEMFAELAPERYQELFADPFTILVLLEAKIIASWFSFFLRLSRDLESVDSTTGVDTPDEVLFNKATHVRREILLPLDRFYRQLEGHEGFLSYVSKGTKSEWGPSLVIGELGRQIRSIQILRIRADQLRSRANGILELIFNNISIHQARLAIAQSKRSIEMMTLQRYDAEVTYQQGESIRRITALATIFLPLSLATGLLGMNVKELNNGNLPVWVYGVFAAALILLTLAAGYLMSRIKYWNRKFPPPGLGP